MVGRDGWKRKADERKRRLKSAKIRIRDLEASRGMWHERTEAFEAAADELRRESAQAREALSAAHAESERLRDASKKKVDDGTLTAPACGGHCSVTLVRLAVDLVLEAGVWVWLVDHTVQIGASRLLMVVVVGRLLSDVPLGERSLRQSDLRLVHLSLMERSAADTVVVELEKAAERTGAPRQIVSDQGGDLNGGVRPFRQQHDGVAHTHDATPKEPPPPPYAACEEPPPEPAIAEIP